MGSKKKASRKNKRDGKIVFMALVETPQGRWAVKTEFTTGITVLDVFQTADEALTHMAMLLDED